MNQEDFINQKLKEFNNTRELDNDIIRSFLTAAYEAGAAAEREKIAQLILEKHYRVLRTTAMPVISNKDGLETWHAFNDLLNDIVYLLTSKSPKDGRCSCGTSRHEGCTNAPTKCSCATSRHEGCSKSPKEPPTNKR